MDITKIVKDVIKYVQTSGIYTYLGTKIIIANIKAVQLVLNAIKNKEDNEKAIQGIVI